MITRVKGLPKLIRKLESIEKPRVRRKIVRGAVSKATTPWNKEAKRRVPSAHPEVRRAIGKSHLRTYGSGVVLQVVGPRVFSEGYKDKAGRIVSSRTVARTAYDLEFGTEHTPAQPIIRPAFDATRSQVETIMVHELGTRIDAELRK